MRGDGTEITDAGRRRDVMVAPDPVKVVPHQVSDEHHTRCPICVHLVAEIDLG